MDTSLSFTLSQEDFLLFHKSDRDLYNILVTNLSRDPYKSAQLLAMWLWLERVGFHDVVKKIVSLPVILIDEIVVESMMCLSCITNNNNTSQIEKSYYEENDIPLLQSLMDKEISLKFFLENRVEAIRGVEKTEKEVCMRALSDIMQQAIMRNMTHRMMNNNNFWFGSIGPANLQFGPVRIDGAIVQQQNNNNEGRGGEIIPAEDRTLFVTFSKGCHVEEWEVKNFFTMVYGDCIEALFMQKTAPNEQALFARIVLHKVDTIDMILRGHSKAKFFINGKHIWARKFVPKRVNISKTMFPGETSGFGSGFGM
ncbi:hypothetical protein MtrunA17_Chr2g0327301 [Medicago truncatula]|uniref:Uncharacterized protein n=1 Tax=Medicago truncatula TaxID=3880 RepID=G8A147_MEDTR|nr:uncharacterized protein LOC25487860 [Medicago truncatula]KEH39394.1 hypothetical protein MTR_2g095470 [Medicago truncatula]RHN76000.1 hypothetical protein MtrunA17_Chr2g0327301 [Medicago truncatula]